LLWIPQGEEKKRRWEGSSVYAKGEILENRVWGKSATLLENEETGGRRGEEGVSKYEGRKVLRDGSQKVATQRSTLTTGVEEKRQVKQANQTLPRERTKTEEEKRIGKNVWAGKGTLRPAYKGGKCEERPIRDRGRDLDTPRMKRRDDCFKRKGGVAKRTAPASGGGEKMQHFDDS